MKYIKLLEEYTNNNPYTELCNNKDLDAVKELIKKGVDPSINNNIVLIWASHLGYLDIINLLLKDNRVDPSARNNEPLKHAIKEGHIEVVKTLLSDRRMDLSDLDKFESFDNVVYELLNSAKSVSDDMLILLLKQPYIKNNIPEEKLLYYMQPFLDEIFIKMNESFYI